MKYFITGIGTNVGKTYVAKRLCQQNGWKMAKPVASGGGEEGISSPWVFSAPISPDIAASREGKSINFDELVEYCKASAADIIEGAGGVMTPLTANKTNLDLIKALQIPAILVVSNYLGAISHTLTALRTLEGIKTTVIINAFEVADTKPAELIESIKNFTGFEPVILSSDPIKL